MFFFVRYQQWGLAFLTHEAYNTIEFAKGLLEWMSDAIQKKFDNNRENTFNFKSLTLTLSLCFVFSFSLFLEK
jgi:hypothetical protein